jgi:hypothetical protein
MLDVYWQTLIAGKEHEDGRFKESFYKGEIRRRPKEYLAKYHLSKSFVATAATLFVVLFNFKAAKELSASAPFEIRVKTYARRMIVTKKR